MASGSSSAERPMPSSATRMRVSPPPSACTSIRVAPASSAFSTSSLTALAGRSTTSPAAMRLTVSGGRRRIGMARLSADGQYRAIPERRMSPLYGPCRPLLALLLTAALAAPAAAQAPIAPAKPDPNDPDAVVVEELVVMGRLPGPAWWTVSDGAATVYVLGAPSLAPKRMQWDRALFERRLEGANLVVLPFQDVKVTVTGAVGAACNF